MSVTSGFFDSVDGDRLYNAEQMSNYFDGLVSNGVYETVGDRFAVSAAASGMAVNVASGRAIIDCHWIKNDAVEVLTLDPADVQMNRIDAICLRLDRSARSITLTVKKGTPTTGTPSIPAITRYDDVYELYIASVLVSKNATSPTSITDLRPSTYCGWVTGIIKQVDTSDLFAQWQAAYDAQFAAFRTYIAQQQAAFDIWFENLTRRLTVDTSIEKVQNVVSVGGGNGCFIGIPDYSTDFDVLFVYVNGLHLTEGFDYEQKVISGQNAIKLLNGREFNSGDKVAFDVLKNVIGGDVLNVSIATVFATGFSGSRAGNATFEEV